MIEVVNISVVYIALYYGNNNTIFPHLKALLHVKANPLIPQYLNSEF